MTTAEQLRGHIAKMESIHGDEPIRIKIALPWARELLAAKESPLDYAQIIASLAFLTDEQRAGFFALVGASYCLTCGSVDGNGCHCMNDE